MNKIKVQITESELTDHISSILFGDTTVSKKIIKEGVTTSDKADIKSLVRAEIKDFLKITQSESLDKMVSDMVKESIKKDKDVEKHMVEITKSVLIEFYKTLWTRRTFISSISI